jgi:hypothetical protein
MQRKRTNMHALCYLYVNNGLNSKYAVIQPIGKFKPVIINFINGYIGYLQMNSYSRKSDRIHAINYEKIYIVIIKSDHFESEFRTLN